MAYEQNSPAPELRASAAFEGDWKVAGRNFPVAPGGGEESVQCEEHFHWLDGDFFLIGSWKHLTESGGHKGSSVLGFDEEKRTLFTTNYDNLGFVRTYTFRVEKNEWTYIGEQERAVRVFDESGNGFTEKWELKNDAGEWIPLCELRGARVPG